MSSHGRRADERRLDGCVEELLRLYGPVYFRSPVALVDTKVAGEPIKCGEAVLPLIAAANRDPTRFPEPDLAEPDRPAPRDHFAFNFGPRTCVGAALARAELKETLRLAVQLLPGLALDPDQPAPRLSGWLLREWRPVHATWDA